MGQHRGEAGVVALQIDALPVPVAPSLGAGHHHTDAAMNSYKSGSDAHSHPPFQHHHEPPRSAEKESDRVIYFRKLVAEDIDQVRELHETWFPIRYNQVRTPAIAACHFVRYVLE